MNLRPLSGPMKGWWARMSGDAPLKGLLRPRTPAGATVWLSLVAAFLLSGFAVVRPGEVGYGRLFGAVAWRDLPPGLHYLAPWPFARADKWPVREVKSVTSGTAGEYLTGDVSLMSMSLNVQYRVRDPYVYHYRVANPEQVIGDNIRKELRKFVAGRTLDNLLNVERALLQDHIEEVFDKRLPGGDSALLDAIELVKVNLLSVSPVGGAMNAFREVSSSQDDRERIIVNAQRLTVSLIPRAHGNAEYEVQQAKGEASTASHHLRCRKRRHPHGCRCRPGSAGSPSQHAVAREAGNFPFGSQQNHRPEPGHAEQGSAVEEVARRRRRAATRPFRPVGRRQARGGSRRRQP